MTSVCYVIVLTSLSLSLGVAAAGSSDETLWGLLSTTIVKQIEGAAIKGLVPRIL